MTNSKTTTAASQVKKFKAQLARAEARRNKEIVNAVFAICGDEIETDVLTFLLRYGLERKGEAEQAARKQRAEAEAKKAKKRFEQRQQPVAQSQDYLHQTAQSFAGSASAAGKHGM